MKKSVSLYYHPVIGTILIVLMSFSSGWYIASACIAKHKQQASADTCEKKCCSRQQDKKSATAKQSVSCCCVTYAAAYIRSEHTPIALYELGKTTPFYSFSVLLAQYEPPHQPPRG